MSPRTTKWLIAGVITSITLNMFLAAWLIAWGWRGGMHLFGMPIFGPPPPSHVERMSGNPLPPHLRKVIDIDDTQLRSLMQEARLARRVVGEALATEPFDAARLEHALSGLRISADRIQQELHHAMLRVAIEGGPEARRAMAPPHRDRRKNNDRREEHDGNHGGNDRPPPPPDY